MVVMSADWKIEVCQAISDATGRRFELLRAKHCSGGCIHHAEWLEGKCGRSYFVKTNQRAGIALFEAEAAGLNAIYASKTIRVPEAICLGQTDGGTAYLVLEAIEMHGRGQGESMGRQLAAMHQVEGDYFGWDTDNFIGSTPQKNGRYSTWIEFYREQRLEFQFKQAATNGLSIPESGLLLEHLDFFFADYVPRPSLLHGDLWGGNASFTAEGDPVIFDPAVYYGDRETDIAFTSMFGGFDRLFYQGYEAVLPLNAGFAQRKPLYNLYHELNHYNLFGGGYGAQAQRTVRQLVGSLQ